MISMWLQIPTVQASGGGASGWALEGVIDVEEKLRLLYPDLPVAGGSDVLVELTDLETGTEMWLNCRCVIEIACFLI